VRFTQYDNQAHRARCGAQATMQGEIRPGQLLSQAPGGVWIIPTERRPADPKVALLGHRSNAESTGYYVLSSENAVVK
jgi:hypothetical protein